MIRHNLPPESLSKYYEERKKIIFYKKDVKSNENLYLNLLKQSQLVVNEKFSNCLKFFTIPEDIYNLSVALKENIANYSLIFSLYFIEGENLNAYKLFLLMCEQNKSSIKLKIPERKFSDGFLFKEESNLKKYYIMYILLFSLI
jgi:hypothetical protein